jgi:ATP-dependent DNA ligase
MISKFLYPDKPTTCEKNFVKNIDYSKYIAQKKYDGWRIQIYNFDREINTPSGIIPKGMCILTRMGNFLSDKVKINIDLKNIQTPINSIFDGEFVGPRGKQQQKINIFDCLAINDIWNRDIPYLERYQICEKLNFNSYFCLTENYYSDFESLFSKLKTDWMIKQDIDEFEGIVIKHKKGKLILSYNDCKKSPYMFKYKYRDIRDERY